MNAQQERETKFVSHARQYYGVRLEAWEDSEIARLLRTCHNNVGYAMGEIEDALLSEEIGFMH